jgi:hypothetical protein
MEIFNQPGGKTSFLKTPVIYVLSGISFLVLLAVQYLIPSSCGAIG